MDLFDIIPDNFFSILSSKNKKLYCACLVQAFKVYEMASILGIEKKILADELTHYLETSSFQFDTTEEDQEDDDIIEVKNSKRSLAYLVLRKFEECGWIYIDVNMDYEEILNFTDAGIIVTEALMKINPLYSYQNTYDDSFDDDQMYQIMNQNEYNGYIYTIYSLLTNPMNSDYAMILNQVYSNTRQLIRSLRRLDSRMKDYIQTVVDNGEIRDLISKLVDYKTELVDNGYAKLKTGDNINKYRLPIVSKLEEYEQNENIVYLIAQDYMSRYMNYDEAVKRVYHDLDDIIDVFNSLDDFISEIDLKNKKYIDSTIGKIKFLLSEDDNITGKINTILKYIKFENKSGHIDNAINTVNKVFTLRSIKTYNQESSLYTPRGRYSRIDSQNLDLSEFDFNQDAYNYLKEFGLPYDDKSIKIFASSHMINNTIVASDIIGPNTDLDTVMMVIYTLMYACEQQWEIKKLDNEVKHFKFTFKDFMIKVGE